MEEILNSLLNKKFNYKNKIITIQKWKKVSSSFVIITDKQTYNFYEKEIKNFVEELEIVKVKLKEGILEKRQMELQNTAIDQNKISEKSTDLTEILYETINKLKEDKNYIAQANAICNVVSQMINIKKLELQLKNKL